MNAFIVAVENKPGELARVAEAVGAKAINITSASTLAWGDKGAVGLLTGDESGTRQALDEGGFEYHETETVTFRLENRPGTLAEASRRLAAAGVNIEFLVPTGMASGEVTIAAAVDHVASAREALRELVAAGS